MADTGIATTNNNINHSSSARGTSKATASIFENGTIMGAVYEYSISYNNNGHSNSSINYAPEGPYGGGIPEIIISGSHSSQQQMPQPQHRVATQQQHQQQQQQHEDSCDALTTGNCDEAAVESTALLNGHQEEEAVNSTEEEEDGIAEDAAVNIDSDALPQDEFERFVMNRSTSDSNILESSIYSELQFPPSIGSVSIGGGSSAGMGNSMAQQRQLAAARAQLQLAAPPPSSANGTNEFVDLLNTSTCSRDSQSQSRAGKRTRLRKHKSNKSNASAKWSASSGASNASSAAATPYPPQYTAIFLEHGNVTAAAAAANAMGQLANATAASPFLNAPLVDAAGYLQQPYQLITTTPYAHHHLGHHHRHLHHRHFLEAGNTIDATSALNTTNNISLNVGSTIGTDTNALTHTSTSVALVRSTFRKCFSRPVVPFVIGIFALGGAACTLGGVVLGATGLIEHTTQYLSASLLMIGIGLSLLIVAGIIWRLSSPNDADECPCYRLMETCRNCNSPYCNNRILTGSYLYPEFQHRPPPPSYLTSLHECAAIGLLNGAVYSGLRVNTPPPLYRSTNSLGVYVANAPTALTTESSGILAPNDHNAAGAPPALDAVDAAMLPPNVQSAPNATNDNINEQTAAPNLNTKPNENLNSNLNSTPTPTTTMQYQTQFPAPAPAPTSTPMTTLTKELNYLELD